MSEISFEDAFKKLEEIAQRLETDELSLEESLRLYEEGIKFSRICLNILNKAEKRIEIVTISEEGDINISEVDVGEFLGNE
ncbi:MAG TPA: exodeoxyribonuclease VII small subunit [Candidatus Atribacteria bacterium]|nr:exodeoxyribonuclease VII small subunit [Candidatus Atribacteria bacterium]